jgi:RNA polymerase sigma-70 factor (ECF subfamily)
MNSSIPQDIDSQLPALRRFAFTFCRNQNDAENLAQETVMKALGAIHLFQPGTNLKSWLFTIMRNQFSTQYQRSKRVVIGIDETSVNLPKAPPSQEWVVRGRDLEIAFSGLPAHLHEALRLVFIEGASYEDAAQSCKCALGTIKSRVNRGRDHLATLMGDDVRHAASI